MPANGSRGPRTALYGGDALSEADEGEASSATNEAFTSPKQEDLSERAVIHACSLPGRSAWAAQGDAAFVSLEEVSGMRTTASAAPAASSSTSSSWRGIKAKLPLGDDDPSSMGVILKIYDLSAAEALQISDVVDVVGILDRSSMPNAEWASTGAPSSSSSCPPAAQLHPALHVVLLETSTHVWMGPMPLLRPGSASEFGAEGEDLASATASLSVADNSSNDFDDDVEKSRASLISELAKRLQGDEVAAEWALLASIASIHTRKAPFALGHLSLRLLLPASPEEGEEEEKSEGDGDLAIFLSTILPSVAPLDVTLESLNAAHVRFAPRNGGEAADDEGLSLLSGRLQLPRGTTVVVRESMAEGRLSSHGLQNLQALQGVLKKQSLGYVFPYSPSPYDLPVDLPILVVSSGADLGVVEQTGEGSSTKRRRRRAAATGGLVEADVDVAVQPRRAAAAQDAAGPSTPSSSLTTMRRHLIKSRRLATSLHVSESVAQAIQQDFVSSRSSGTSASSASSQEDLLRRMDVARLLAASECRYDLTFEDYKRAKELDVMRAERLKVRKEEVKRGNVGAGRAASGAGAGTGGQAPAS